MVEEKKPQAQPETPQWKKAMEIYMDQHGHIMLKAPMENKGLCIHWLCEAIKIVTAFKKSTIIKPSGHGIMNFARKIAGKK